MTEPNILQFPKDKIVRETLPDIEELNKVKEKSIKNFADAVVEDISSNLLFELGNYGIETDSMNFVKDYHFMIAILTATIYRTLSVEHSLHKFMDENVVLESDILEDQVLESFSDEDDIEIPIDKED